MKTILIALFLTGVCAWAQVPPPGGASPASPRTPADTARMEAFRRMRMGLTNAPVTPLNPTLPGAATPPLPAVGPAASLPPGAAKPDDKVTTISPSPGAADAPEEEMVPPGLLKLANADLNQVLTLYADFVNRTVLRPASLPAPTITLMAQTPLSRKEAVQALDAILGMNGVAMINIGDKFVKAVPTGNAGNVGQEPSNLPPEQLSDLGPYLTHVVQLNYVKPSEVMPAITPFASAGQAGIVPIESSQILVLRDYTENVKRMLEMIKKIDIAVPAEYTNEVIMIKYALAADIASALNSLSSGGGGGGTTVGTRPGGSGTRSSGFGASRAGGTSGMGGMGGMGGANPYGANQGMTTPGVTTPGAAGGAGSSFTDRLRNIINRSSTTATGEIQIIGQTKIIADERTNSLLVYATREDLKTIKEIVAKLDVVLAQVLIEAVIIQVDLGNSRNLGVSYAEQKLHPNSGYFQGIGAVNNGTMFTGSPLINSATNVASSLPGGFSYLAHLGGDLDVSLTALASDNHAKILQRPRIQTSHGVQAQLFVGQSRPYPTGSYYGGGAYGGYSSIQQMQIGVSLDVTPLINPDGLVVMDIHQKIDSVSGTVNIANVGDVPITSSKEASAKVAVRDKDTIMLGGLIETDKSDSASGVPYLKDLPLLGHLFRSSTSSDSRSELIVLIRPTVLPTPEIAALAAKAEKEKMPGVRSTEAEIQKEENKRIQAVDKASKSNN